MGFRGGFVGDEIRRMIYQFGLNEKLIELEEGISRINVKVLGKAETEINGEGPLIGGIMSTQKNRLLSTTMKPGLLHSRHGWKT